MNKNLLLALGAAAILAGCSNEEVFEQNPQVQPSDVAVSLNAESNITITQSRAAVTAWKDTPIRVWGLNKAANADWTESTSNLFSTSYVNGTVAASTGVVSLGKTGDVFFYPLSSDVSFSFFSCSPLPDAGNSLHADRVIANYTITGNKDILWGEAVAKDKLVDGTLYSGYNARFFRKNGDKPILQFKHKLTQLLFKGVKGTEGEGSIYPVAIKNITVKSTSQATLGVAGVGKSVLTATGTESDIPVFFEDQTYADHGTVALTPEGANAGSTMVFPSTTGTYSVNITLSATVNGVEKTMTSPVTIVYKDKVGQPAPFEEGKAYTIRLTIYGLNVVEANAILTPWDANTEIIDQEVN